MIDCNKCKVQGDCCYLAIPIEGFNIILDHQPCPYLNLKTKKCKDYTHRKQNAFWCLHDDQKYNVNALPKGCLYLKGHPERENNPKVHIKDVIDKISYQGIMEYNIYNNIPFIKYTEFLIRNDNTLCK